MTALLHSSTATGLMTASFAAEGVVGLVPALAISEQDSAGHKRAAASNGTASRAAYIKAKTDRDDFMALALVPVGPE